MMECVGVVEELKNLSNILGIQNLIIGLFMTAWIITSSMNSGKK